MSSLIIYTSDDGNTRINLRVEADSIWLSQLEIAELFKIANSRVASVFPLSSHDVVNC